MLYSQIECCGLWTTHSQHQWKEEECLPREAVTELKSRGAVLSGCCGAESHPLHTLLPAQRSHCGANSRARLINTNCEAERAFPGTWLHSQAAVIHLVCVSALLSITSWHKPGRSFEFVALHFHCLLVLRTEMNSFKCLPSCVQLPTMETCIYLEDIMLIWIDTSTTSGNSLQVIFVILREDSL